MSEIVHAHLKRAVKGTLFISFASGFGLLFWFSSKLLLVRILTQEEFGIYSLSLTIINVFLMLASAGIPEGVARYTSLFLGEDRGNEAAAISRTSIRLIFISALISFGLLFFLSDPLSRYVFYKPELSLPLKILSFSIPFTLFVQVFSGILRGHGIMRPKIYLDLGQPLFFLFCLICLLFIAHSLKYVLGAYSSAIILIFSIIAIYAYKEKGLVIFTRNRGHYSSKLLRFSLPLLGAGLITFIFVWTDTLMLGRYESASEVGIYNIAVTLYQLLGFPLTSLTFVFMPLGVEMLSKGQSKELARTYRVITKWLFSATLPIFFVLFFFPEMTIRFLYGEGFIGASGPLRLLSFGAMLYILAGPSNLFLIIFGLPNTIMYFTVTAGLANIFLNYLFIKTMGWGMMGAALATFLSGLIITFWSLAAVYRRVGIHPLTGAYLKPVLGSVIVGLLMYTIVKGVGFFSILLMPVYLFLFLLGYAACLLLTRSLEREDIFLLDLILEKIGFELKFFRSFLLKFAKE